MKLLQNADVRFADAYLDEDEYHGARIVKNGSKVTITVPEEGRPNRRLDRLFAATWTEKGNKEVVITGRSEYLRDVINENDPEDQMVTIIAKGFECDNCRGIG